MNATKHIPRVIGLILISSGVVAQETPIVAPMWSVFVEECGKFFEEPQVFIDNLPVPGPLGERVLHSTQDQQILYISTVRQDYPFFGVVFAAKNRRDFSCSFSITFDEKRDLTELDQEFGGIVLVYPEATVIGGLMEFDLAYGRPGNLNLDTPPAQIVYEVIDLFEGVRSHSSVSFSQYSVTMTAGYEEFAR